MAGTEELGAAVTVWWMPVPPAFPLAAVLPRLTAEERAAAQRFAFAADRHAYAAAHALLAHALDRVTGGGWRLGRQPGGKPVVEAPAGLHVSLSHSRGMVAVGVTAAGPLGVDVEAADRALSGEDVAALVLAPVEREALQAAQAADRSGVFLGLWTGKEAVIKATGQGLAADLRGFAIALDPPRLLTRGPDGSAASAWRLFARALPGHHLAVAVKTGRAAGLHLEQVSAEALAGAGPRGD